MCYLYRAQIALEIYYRRVHNSIIVPILTNFNIPVQFITATYSPVQSMGLRVSDGTASVSGKTISATING